MQFSEAPTRVPIQCMQPGKQWPIGRKTIIGDNVAFVTDATTWLFVPNSRCLIQVCPFRPENTMPADGFMILQMDFYLPVSERLR